MLTLGRLQAVPTLQLFPDLYTAAGVGALLAGFAAVLGLIITLRSEHEARLLTFFSEKDAAISLQLEIEKDLNGLEQCIVYAYNYLDLMEGIAFLRLRRKIPEYAARYYKSFFEYGITMMAWYTSIPEREGSQKRYDTRSIKDNWPSLVEWLGTMRNFTAYGVEHLPPEMVRVLDASHVDRSKMFAEVQSAIGAYIVA